ncbi:hypothetical protein AZ16_0882, partial [Bordetella bronchiseptica B18-5 (C3)]
MVLHGGTAQHRSQPAGDLPAPAAGAQHLRR